MELLELASLIFTILTIVLIYKLDRTKKLRIFLDRLFLVDIIYNKLESDKRYVIKFLKFASRLFQIFYLFYITLSFYIIIFDFNLISILAIPVLALQIFIVPFLVRILLKFQFMVHGIRVNSD